MLYVCFLFCVFFNDTATTEIYTLSLHDALPILVGAVAYFGACSGRSGECRAWCRDRKSGSAGMPRPISYAVFCLKKKKKITHTRAEMIAPIHTLLSPDAQHSV